MSVARLTSAVLAAACLTAGAGEAEAPAHCSAACDAACASSWGRRPVLPARRPARRLVVPILMYHRIDVALASEPAITKRLTVHPDDFARQLRWLESNGYRPITQRELFEALFQGRRIGRRPILITFDDGYRDVFSKAAPVLVRLGFKATAYVITERIVPGDRVFLGWGLVRALERKGIEIGSHSVSHRDLTQLSEAEVLSELVQSRRALERGLCHPVPWFAYPFGRYDARIERLAERAGYVLAVTTQHGSVQSAARPFALRRIRVLDSTGVGGLAALLGVRSSRLR